MNEWDVNNAASLTHVSLPADVQVINDLINYLINQLDLIQVIIHVNKQWNNKCVWRSILNV